MAKKKSGYKRMKNLQPAVMQIEMSVPTGRSYVDLNLVASLINRRAYKQQGTNWAVSHFEMLAPGTGLFSIAKLPETWVCENALVKSRALWNKMNDQVLDENPAIDGKYADFKVYMDSEMKTHSIQTSNNPTGRILTPSIGSDWTQANFDESAAPKANWDWSTIQVPNDPTSGTTTEYTLHVVGTSTSDSMGIIQGYGLSRSRPQLESPNAPGATSTADWMTALFDAGENFEEIKTDLIEDNDRPPYAVGSPGFSEYYPGGGNEYNDLQVHGFTQFTTTTVSNKTQISGGLFQLGMFAIENQTEANVVMLVHLLPGPHRGYLVEA